MIKMKIDSYSFGKIKVGEKEYTNDLIIFPDRIKTNWWRKKGHSLCREDLEEVLEFKPDILVVGKGDSGLMKIPDQTKEVLEQEGIELIAEKTKKACKTFNKLSKKKKKVVGAFHLTC